MKRFLYSLVILLSVLTACERPISYHGEYEEPKLVVQALLNAGADSIVCIVERSYFFLESMNNNSNTLDNVTIDIASTFIDSLQVLRDVTNGNEHKLYLSHPLQANDTIRLIISHPELGIATAKEWITPKFEAEIKSAIWDSQHNQCRFVFDFPDAHSMPELQILMQCTTYITETRIVTKKNFNGKLISCDTIHNTHTYVQMIQSKNKIFNTVDNTYEEGMFCGRTLSFNTDYLSAKNIEIILPIELQNDTTTIKLSSGATETRYYTYTMDSCMFTFEAQSPNSILYMKSMRAYMGLNNDNNDAMDIGALFSDMLGIEEPVAVYSNIENGYGIVLSRTTHNILIKDLTLQ